MVSLSVCDCEAATTAVNLPLFQIGLTKHHLRKKEVKIKRNRDVTVY
jgi:hypothetical protein